MNLGVAASPSLRRGERSPLARLFARHEDFLRRVAQAALFAVGGTCDALATEGLFDSYAGLYRLPRGVEGGLMSMVAQVVSDDPAEALDAVVYLVDPNDPTSVFPEALALKRQCVVHGRPFLSTFAGADEWLELARLDFGLAPRPEVLAPYAPARTTLALIAHDRRKADLERFAAERYEFLSGFAERVSTGTTGGLLNAMAARRTGDPGRWTEPMLSGPLGGDAQIARRVLRRGGCVLFFEDPHVAREHEADIQLLERAARVRGEATRCIHDLASAEAWAGRWKRALTR